ncbi:MAG: CaiB/BaiF CoA transferase family protein [Candidatus Hodarchaeales archaeon]|jgi:crotonobetainyl-CoA:carnitine CoA-transferase CaiB-like acyl-CoA transferase
MVTLPLEGVLILDFTRLLPGPFATQILADLGARVIKIESPITDMIRFTPPFIEGDDKDEMWSGLFLAVNRNKESVSLNLKKENHKKVLRELLKKADVFIEGFRPGVMKKLGFDYETVSANNPKIIYCSISGFGQNGSMKSRPAHDINYLSLAGLLSDICLNHATKRYPPIIMPMAPIADLSGGMFAVIAILTAIVGRNNTEKGSYIDTSLFESIFFWLSGYPGALKSFNSSSEHGFEEEQEKRELNSNGLSGKYPYYSIYLTKDSKWLSVGALEPVFWEEFCKILNIPEFIDKQHESASSEELMLVYNKIQEIFVTKNQEDWIKEFEGVNTCVYPLKTLTDLKSDEQLVERGMLLKVPHPAGGFYLAPNLPIKFSQWKINQKPKKPPETGENSLNILREFGIDENLISDSD